MSPGPIVIKKYPNRRLYDTAKSRYINLEDIAVFIREGKDVQVLDAQTGEDLTRVTLTQIIVDDAKQQPTGLPLELLKQLIVSSDQVGREFIMWYLKSAYDAYHAVQTKLQSGLTEMQTAAMSPIGMMKNFIQSQVAGKSAVQSSSPNAEELRLLRERIAELEARIDKPKQKAKKGKAPQRRKTAKR
jgi:polyhydroxyalkanoate synthesis repressor PhaR